jgi:hypothetical protein
MEFAAAAPAATLGMTAFVAPVAVRVRCETCPSLPREALHSSEAAGVQ